MPYVFQEAGAGLKPMVSITKEVIPLGLGDEVSISGLPSFHHRSPLPTQDPLFLGVLRVLRSKLCLAISVKREICPKWASKNHTCLKIFQEVWQTVPSVHPSRRHEPWIILNLLYIFKIFIFCETFHLFYYGPSCPRSVASYFLLFLPVTQAGNLGEAALKVKIFFLKEEEENVITFVLSSVVSSYYNPS